MGDGKVERRNRRAVVLASVQETRPAHRGNACVRLHHRGGRLGRLGHGPSVIGPQRQQGAAVRGRPGHAARQGAARNRRQLFRHGLLRSALPLDRTQGPHPGRVAQQSAGEPAAAAQVRAGARAGRRLVDQRPDGQSRRADRLQRMGEPRRRRLGLGPGPAVLQEGRARPRFRWALARQGRPHSRSPHSARALDGSCQGGSAGLRGQGLQVPAGPERRIRRRLLPGHAFQCRGAARVGGDGLSRRRDAQALQPHHLDRHAGEVAAVRGHAMRRRHRHGRRPGEGIPRP